MSLKERVLEYKSEIEKLVHSELVLDGLIEKSEPLDLQVELSKDSSSTEQVTFSRNIFSWKLGDLINSKTNIINFVKQMVNQCAVGNSNLTDIEDKVQNLLDDKCEMYVNECYFYYETQIDAKEDESVVSVKFILSLCDAN